MPETMDDDWLDDQLAAMMAPEDTRYLVVCRECRAVWPYKRDCKTTKAVRDDEAVCTECGSTLEMAYDPLEDSDE